MKIRYRDDRPCVELTDIDDPDFQAILLKAGEYCMHAMNGSFEVLYALYNNIRYIVKADIPGDFVECGVWKGGMVLLAALTFQHFGDTSRKLYLYDTFDGNAEPTSLDGDNVRKTYDYWRQKGLKWGFGGSLGQVSAIVGKAGYPDDKLIFVEGKVEDTLPTILPQHICILRLDTDLYDSTYHELHHLYPLLSMGGVLIVDDYGLFRGSRKATDAYIAEHQLPIMLSRIAASPREAIKR